MLSRSAVIGHHLLAPKSAFLRSGEIRRIVGDAREEGIMGDQHERHEQVAGNGLLHRRMFLAAGAAAAAGASTVPSGVSAAPLPVEPWMQVPGAGFNGYGQPSKYEEKVART